ncbi:MAG: YfhO family protein [bacterium]
MKLYKSNLATVILFTILALIITFPIIFNMSKLIYGYPDDTLTVIWGIWRSGDVSLQIKDFLLFPSLDRWALDYNIYAHTLWPMAAFLTNEIFIWNLFSIFNFILSAFFMCLLVRYLTESKISAFISGIIYGFCPHICMQSFNHILLAATQWMPLYILFLLKLVFEKNYKNAVLCGIFYALVVFSNPYYGYYMLLFTMIFIVFLLLRHIKNLRAVIKTDSPIRNRFLNGVKLAGVAFLTALIIVLPAEYKVIKTMFSKSKNKPAVYTRPLEGLIFSGARPKDFLLPPRTNPILKNISRPFMSPDFGSMIDHTLYLGYTPLILSIIAVCFWRRRKNLKFPEGQAYGASKIQNSKLNLVVPFFLIIFFAFGIMSSPPWIPIGALKLNSALFKLPMPSYFLHKLFPMFRYYSRMVVVMMISLSVLSGIGMKFLLEKFKIKNLKLKIVFTSVIFLLIGVEYINVPPFHYFDSTPPKLYTWLAKQEGEFGSAVAEYPMLAGRTQVYGYMFWQRVHKQKLVNGGDSSRLEKLLHIDNPQTVQQLREWGVKYVIVHRDFYEDKDYKENYNVPMPIIDEERLGLKLIKSFNQRKNKHYKEQYMSPNVYFDKFFGKTDVYCILEK